MSFSSTRSFARRSGIGGWPTFVHEVLDGFPSVCRLGFEVVTTLANGVCPSTTWGYLVDQPTVMEFQVEFVHPYGIWWIIVLTGLHPCQLVRDCHA